jgi:DNA-binding CsgD family transcriptional regulator
LNGSLLGDRAVASLIIRANEGKAPAVALSARDLRKIIEIIDVTYSVPDNSAMFNAVCGKLQNLIGINSGVFTYADPKTSAYLINGCESFQIAQGAIVLYVAHYAQFDPFVTSRYYLGNRINIAARNTDLVSKNSLLKSEFACDFLLSVGGVFYCLAAALGSQGDIVAILGFHRQKTERDFTERDKQVVNMVLPHMARAIHNRNLMQRLDLGEEPGGVVAIGEDGRKLFVNDAAKKLLMGRPVESIPDPGMSPNPVFFKSKSCTYRVRTMPLRRNGKGKVVLLERYPPENRLQPKFADFKLSRRESDIAVFVVQGYSNREIAERSFICEQTVKDHLHAIFEKLEIRSRGELTAKVLGLRTGQLSL